MDIFYPPQYITQFWDKSLAWNCILAGTLQNLSNYIFLNIHQFVLLIIM